MHDDHDPALPEVCTDSAASGSKARRGERPSSEDA